MAKVDPRFLARAAGAASSPQIVLWALEAEFAHEKGQLAFPPTGRNQGSFELERETRFELATSTLARLHSTTELLPRAEAEAYLALGGVAVNRRLTLLGAGRADGSLASASRVGAWLVGLAETPGVMAAGLSLRCRG